MHITHQLENIKIIREYIPKNYDVANGFVLFVHNATEERKIKKGFDPLNMGSYSVSRQCDIIVYDSSTIPVIFKDDDFVIVRPESVRCIIEVKSKANRKEVDNILNSFNDFALKWQKSFSFYKEHNYAYDLKKPILMSMCWEIAKNKKGYPLITNKRIREQIANFYNINVDKDNLKGFPILNELYCYNEFEICDSYEIQEKEILQGWSSLTGKFIRYSENNEVYYDGDSTISKLLATIHWSLGSDNFNRFYSYHCETKENGFLGFSKWLDKSEQQKELNSDRRN